MKKTILSTTAIFIASIGFVFWFENQETKKETVYQYPLTIQELKPVCEVAFAQSQLHAIFEYKGYQGDYSFLYGKNILCSSILTAKRGYIWDSLDISIDTINRTVSIAKANPTWLSIETKCEFLHGEEGVFTSLTPSDYNKADSLASSLLLSQVNTAELDKICTAGLQNFLYHKVTGKNYKLLL